ncbi:MAG: four helix bundle protein [Bacteroidota bacterium]
MRTSKEKEAFINFMKKLTKSFAIEVIDFCNNLDLNSSSKIISYQLIKSATSTGANYRAACRSRSKKEFYAKICIVVEEADESQYWLEIIKDSSINCNKIQLNRLIEKIGKILAIVTRARSNTFNQ